MTSGKKEITVSVVIPTYNSAAFISNVLNSLVQQTISQDSLEVIVINDCSTDDTEKVIRGYGDKLKNLRIFKTAKNTGNPIAGRNMGIKKAKGEYIHFIDHDDYLGSEALERLYNAAKGWRSDVISGKFVFIENSREITGINPAFVYGDVQRVDPFVHTNITAYLAPHRMFRRRFLVDNDIFYDPNVTYGEDVYFVMKSFVNAEVISIKADYNYYYRIRRDDKGNLTNHQNKHYSYYTKNYKTLRVLEEIHSSNSDEHYKVQWAKLYLQRYLGPEGHAGSILEARPDPEKLRVINEVVLRPAGELILSSLSSEYKLLIQLAKLGESSSRDTLLGSILNPEPHKVKIYNNRAYIRAYDNTLYDTSMLYRSVYFSIKSIFIKDEKLVVTVAIDFRTIIKDEVSYFLKLENRGSGYVVEHRGKNITNNDFQFDLDIRNMISVAGDLKADYNVYLRIRGKVIDLTVRLCQGDSINYTEEIINQPRERYLYRNRSLIGGGLVASFSRRKYYLLHNIKQFLR